MLMNEDIHRRNYVGTFEFVFLLESYLLLVEVAS